MDIPRKWWWHCLLRSDIKSKESRKRRVDIYIHLLLVFDGSFPSETFPKGTYTAENLSSLPIHTLSPLLVQAHSISTSHACTPSILNFTNIHFLHKFFILLSLKMTKLSQSIYFQPFHYTSFHSICTNSHATSFIAVILSSCHATCSFQIVNFHSTHCCVLFHVQVYDSFRFLCFPAISFEYKIKRK